MCSPFFSSPPPPPPTTGGTAACFNNKPVGAPVNACVVHWIEVTLLRSSDLKARPAWWPPAKPAPYASEPYDATLTNGKTSGSLDGQGSARYDPIPAGACAFHFKKFYEKIDQHFKEKLGG
jgi:hypothetical protein